MGPNGYGQFFKAAREAKKDSVKPLARPKQTSFAKGPKVSDVLRNLKSKRKARKSFPLLPIFSAIVLLGLSLYAYRNIDSLERAVSKIEIRALGFAKAEEKASHSEEKSSQTKEEKEAKNTSDIESSTSGSKQGKTNWTSEQLAFFNKLEERKQQLDVREKELQKLEDELQEQKLALEKRLRDLEEIRTKISSRLDEKVKIDQEKVDKLVEFYSNMKAQNAAKVFGDLDEDLAVEILNKMKKKNAADIMNLLTSEKAQKLSEKFAGYKRQ